LQEALQKNTHNEISINTPIFQPKSIQAIKSSCTKPPKYQVSWP